MTTATLTVGFTDLSALEKAEVLVRFAHELTVLVRESYTPGDGFATPARVRTINEVQHRVLAHAAALMADDPARYPDEVVLGMMLDHPSDPQFEQQVRDRAERILRAKPEAA